MLRAYLLHRPRESCHAGNIPQHTVMKLTWDGWHFPPRASPREAMMKAKTWPPPDSEAWPNEPSAATGPLSLYGVGAEEWIWLGPNTKRSDGQKNI